MDDYAKAAIFFLIPILISFGIIFYTDTIKKAECKKLGYENLFLNYNIDVPYCYNIINGQKVKWYLQ